MQWFCACQSHHKSHPLTIRVWVTELFSPRHSHLIPWPKGCEWKCSNVLPGSFISPLPIGTDRVWATHDFSHYNISSHDQQSVSDSAMTSCQAVLRHPTGCEWQYSDFCSLITSHAMTNRVWVTVPWSFPRKSHLISCHDQQDVSSLSSTGFFCQVVSFHD